jgi:hypothetical protein
MTDHAAAFDEPMGAAPGGPYLSTYDEEYAQAEAPDFDEVPDGKYQVTVHAVRLGESQKGDPMLKWDLVVISGACEGRHIFKNSVITSAALPFVKGDLKVLGLELQRFSKLSQHLEQLLDKKLQVTKKTRDDFVNVYFNRLIGVPGAGGGAEAAADATIPF